MKYRPEEIAGIRQARKNNPSMSQRELALHIYYNYRTYSVDGTRSKQSIYGAIRRVDRQIAAEKADRAGRRRKPAAA